MPVYTTARQYQRSTADRQEGFNGYSTASSQYEVVEVNGSFLSTETSLPISASFTNTPLLERYNVSARKGEPITFSETVIGSSLNVSLTVDPLNDLGTTLVFCGNAGGVEADEFTANIALTYDGPWVCSSTVYVWPRRATGSITLYNPGGGTPSTFPFSSIQINVDVEEDGTDYTLNYGDRSFVTYRIINAEGLPLNSPITI